MAIPNPGIHLYVTARRYCNTSLILIRPQTMLRLELHVKLHDEF